MARTSVVRGDNPPGTPPFPVPKSQVLLSLLDPDIWGTACVTPPSTVYPGCALTLFLDQTCHFPTSGQGYALLLSPSREALA